MRQFIDVMKKVALNAVETTKPVEICYGTVQSKNPFQVRLSQKQILGKGSFIVKNGDTTQSFEEGDILILFRIQGGQQYLIYDKKGAL